MFMLEAQAVFEPDVPQGQTLTGVSVPVQLHEGRCLFDAFLRFILNSECTMPGLVPSGSKGGVLCPSAAAAHLCSSLVVE